jgi:hypothetical protein
MLITIGPSDEQILTLFDRKQFSSLQLDDGWGRWSGLAPIVYVSTIFIASGACPAGKWSRLNAWAIKIVRH